MLLLLTLVINSLDNHFNMSSTVTAHVTGAADIVAAAISNTTAHNINVNAEKKKKRIADLPSPIASANQVDLFKEFTYKVETNKSKNDKYPGENEVAVLLKLDVKEDVESENGVEPSTTEVSYVLDDLTIDQLRALCRQIGCTGYSSLTKYVCRLFIARRKNIRDEIRHSSAINNATRTHKQVQSDLRLTNTILHTEIRPIFMALNDLKTRADHETGYTHKEGNLTILETFNAPTDDKAIIELNLEHEFDRDGHLQTETIYSQVDLRDFLPFASAKAMMNRLKKLFEITKVMRANMTVSGMHESDTMEYVDHAIKKVKGCSRISRHSAYYFYIACEEFPNIEAKFTPLMVEELKGSSTDSASAISTVGSTLRKSNNSNTKMADSFESTGIAITGILNHIKTEGKLKRKLMKQQKAIQ